MKKQHHYTSAKEIERAIDAAHRKVARLLQKADELNREGAKLRQSTSAKDIIDGINMEADAVLLFKKVERLRETRLPKLKRVLAAFNTGLLFSDGKPPSAVLENK